MRSFHHDPGDSLFGSEEKLMESLAIREITLRGEPASRTAIGPAPLMYASYRCASVGTNTIHTGTGEQAASAVS